MAKALINLYKKELEDLHQQLQAANERAAEAEGLHEQTLAYLRAVLDVEGIDDGLGSLKCPWCKSLLKESLGDASHAFFCPHQAAAAYLASRAAEGKE